jgi:hypothetical protein
MSGNKSREANLRALEHMLDYAASESRRLGLSEAVKALATARSIIDDALQSCVAERAMPAPPLVPAKIRLVAGRDTCYKEENETKA